MRWTKQVAIWALCWAMLMWPIAINRGAFLFPDTIPYLSAGRSALAAAGRALHLTQKPLTSPRSSKLTLLRVASPSEPKVVLGDRSTYYGAFVAAASAPFGFVGAAVAQAAWTALVVLLACQRLGMNGWRRIAAISVLCAITSIAFFAGVVMPDVFAGIGVVSIALLLVVGRDMRWPERAFWIANLLAASVFHKAILLVVVGVWVVAAVVPRWRRISNFALPAATIVVAVVATLLVGRVAKMTGYNVVSIPFLLARSVGDGPGAAVLREDCATVDYVSCQFVPGLPLAEIDFLWDSTKVTPWIRLADAERLAVSNEQSRIVAAAVRRYPIAQAQASIGNTVRQFVNLDLTKFGPRQRTETIELKTLPDERVAYRQTLIKTDSFPLAAMTTAYFAIYVIALIVALGLLVSRDRLLPTVDDRYATIAAMMLVSLVISAATTGSFAGVIGRYQARISWLGVFAVIILVNQLFARRRTKVG